MKIVTGLLTMLCIIVAGSSFGYNNEIYKVKFRFLHSLRIPDYNVSVDFVRLRDSIRVSVKSLPRDTVSPKWKETIKVYSFGIGSAKFEKVVATVKEINCTDIVNEIGVSGADGTTCEIEMSGMGGRIVYKVWSPDYETKKRNLQSFLSACKLILSTAKLDPREIL